MCLFCKIANHEIPSQCLYEDDEVMAFLDISPITKGHTLIIPKEHYDNFHSCPSNLVAKIHQVSVQLINQYHPVLKAKGFNWLTNMNSIANQSIFHVHFHLIPRYGLENEKGFDFLAESHGTALSESEIETIKQALNS